MTTDYNYTFFLLQIHHQEDGGGRGLPVPGRGGPAVRRRGDASVRPRPVHGLHCKSPLLHQPYLNSEWVWTVVTFVTKDSLKFLKFRSDTELKTR